jgi:hypothetical protein
VPSFASSARFRNVIFTHRNSPRAGQASPGAEWLTGPLAVCSLTERPKHHDTGHLHSRTAAWGTFGENDEQQSAERGCGSLTTISSAPFARISTGPGGRSRKTAERHRPSAAAVQASQNSSPHSRATVRGLGGVEEIHHRQSAERGCGSGNGELRRH